MSVSVSVCLNTCVCSGLFIHAYLNTCRLFMHAYTQPVTIYICGQVHETRGGALIVTAIVEINGIGDPSSNHKRHFVYFRTNAIWERH